MGRDLGLSLNGSFFQYLLKQQEMMDRIVIGTSILMLIVIVIVGVLFSHRICGPLQRLEGHMRDIGHGKDFLPLRYRKKDFFQEIPSAFNEMRRALLKRSGQSKD